MAEVTNFDPQEAERLAARLDEHAYDVNAELAEEAVAMLRAAIMETQNQAGAIQYAIDAELELKHQIRQLEAEVSRLRTTWEPPRDD